jgi:FtsH-binding integral membrane protein
MGGLAAAKGTVFGVLAAVIFHERQSMEELRQYTYTALFGATLVLLVAELGLMFFIASQIPRQTRRTLDQRMLMLTGLTAVVGFAVWVSTPNMELRAGSIASWQWSPPCYFRSSDFRTFSVAGCRPNRPPPGSCLTS